MAGFGFGGGLGSFATGLDGGIKEGASLANTVNEMKDRKDREQATQAELDLRNKQDARAQTQFDEQQQQYQSGQQDRDLGTKGLATFNQMKDAGQAQGTYSDYYLKNIAPQIINNKIANGDVSGATQLDQWVQNTKNKNLINNLGTMAMQAKQASTTGNVQPLSDSIKGIWDNLPPELSGGSKFQGLQVSKSPSGDIQGITGTYLGTDGKTYQQTWKDVPDLVQNMEFLSHPSVAFQYHQKAGVLDPLVAAATNGTAQPQAVAQPTSAPDDSADFSGAPLASTAAPLIGGAPATGAQRRAVPAPAPVSVAGAPAPSAAPVTPDIGGASAAPAPSSVQPLAADTATPGATPTDQAQPVGELGDVMAGQPAVAAARPAITPIGLGTQPQPQQVSIAAPAPSAPAPQQQVPASMGTSSDGAPQPASLDQINLARKASGEPPLTIDQAAQLLKSNSASKSPAPVLGAGSQQGAPAPVQTRPGAAPNGAAVQPQQPNITIVPTRPVTPSAPGATSQAQTPPAGLSPDIHDAIVNGLSSGDPEATALAKQVLTKYGKPEYDYKTLSDGSLVAVNKANPADSQVVYHAPGTQAGPNVPNLHGDDYLETLSDGDAALVKGIAENRINPNSLSVKGGHRERILSMVTQYKPDFNQTLYTGDQAYQRTSGSAGARVEMASNEVAQALPLAVEASQNLPRGRFVPWNELQQKWDQGTSDPAYNDFVLKNFALVNAYTRAMNPMGVPRITERLEQKANGILSTATSPEAYQVQAKALWQEVERSRAAVAQTRGGTGPAANEVRTDAPMPTSAAPASQSAPAPGHYNFNPASGKLELVQ